MESISTRITVDNFSDYNILLKYFPAVYTVLACLLFVNSDKNTGWDRMKKNIYLGIIIVIAGLGSVLFFPVNIGGRYTCFYHRLFDLPQAPSMVPVADRHKQYFADQEGNSPFSYHQSVLLHNYLHRYAFIWWGSVSILAFCIFIRRKKKRNIGRDDSASLIK